MALVGLVVLSVCPAHRWLQPASSGLLRKPRECVGSHPVAPAQSLRFEGTRAAPPRSLRLLPGHTCVITLPSDWNMLGIKCEFSCPQGSPSCAQGLLLTLTIFGVLATPLLCRLLCCVLATPLPPWALAAGHGTPLSPAQSWRDSSCQADSPPLPLTSVSYSHPVRFGPSTMPPCRLGHLPSSPAPPTVHQATLHPLQCRCRRLGHLSSSPLCSTADDFDSIARWYFGRAHKQEGSPTSVDRPSQVDASRQRNHNCNGNKCVLLQPLVFSLLLYNSNSVCTCPGCGQLCLHLGLFCV